MGNPLLDRASPRELAGRGQVIEKKESLALFTRLAEAVAADFRRSPAARLPPGWQQAPVAFRLVFGWADDRQRVPCVSGRVSASLPAVCQRCLEPMSLPLAQELELLLSGPDSPAAAVSRYEVWELDDALLRPADIVEEVLIMGMPLAPRHADRRDCGPLADRLDAAGSESVRPFADLRARMRPKD